MKTIGKDSQKKDSYQDEINTLERFYNKPVKDTYIGPYNSKGFAHELESILSISKNPFTSVYGNNENDRLVDKNEMKEIFNKSICMINSFLSAESHIIMDSEQLLENIKIFFWDTNNKLRAYIEFLQIHININHFNTLNESEKLHVMIHEIIHYLSVRRIHYKITGNNNGKTNVKFRTNFGYTTAFINKNKIYGEFFNEGITELITSAILNRNNIKHNYLTYNYNIRIIDKMICEIHKRTNIPYKDILDNIIQGYFHADFKTIQWIKNILGYDFVNSIMREVNNNNEESSHNSLAEKGFFNKYDFMEIKNIFDNTEISHNLSEFIYKK